MSKLGNLFDRYDNSVKVKGARQDFPTCTVLAVLDKIEALKTDDDEPRTYLKSHWTVVSVERGEIEVGDQKTIAYFKHKKHKFFERDTKALAGACAGLDRSETDALTGSQVNDILSDGAAGRVLRLRCVQKTQESKKEEGKTVSFTNVEYVGRADRDEILAAVEDKATLRRFFPKGLDAEGRGVGFDESAEDEDEAPAPKAKPKAKRPVESSDDEDEV